MRLRIANVAAVAAASCIVGARAFIGTLARPHRAIVWSRRRSMQMSSVMQSAAKMMHVVYRVGDIDKSVKFYQDVLGMKLLRFRDVPDENYSNAFLGYGTESKGEHFSIELTYNYGVTSYNLGDGFRGMGLCLPDARVPVSLLSGRGFANYECGTPGVSGGGGGNNGGGGNDATVRLLLTGGRAVSKAAAAAGATVLFGPKDVELGPCLVPDEPVGQKSVATVLRLTDPDGYEMEVTAKMQRDPVARVRLSVVNLDRSVAFYEKALGMRLLRKRSNVPNAPQLVAYMGYAEEADGCCLELVYDYSREKVDMGNAYGQIAVSVPDVYQAAEAIKAAGEKVTRDPGPVPGIGTKITALRDPDGYKIVLVDEQDFEKELL